MKKKIFTLFAALTLSAGALFASDTAVGGIYYDFDATNFTATVTYCGNSYDSFANEYQGDVVIPATVTYGGNTYSVTSIGSSAFSGCSGLTSVTIPNSVTSIGGWAFSNCSGLTSVTIGNSVTSIGSYAFTWCRGLTSVVWNAKNYADFSSSSGAPFYDIKSQITSFTFGSEVKHIPAYLCYGMKNLTSVTIPNSVTSIGSSAFNGCSGLTSVVWNAKNCTYFKSDSDAPFYDIRSQITSFTFGSEVKHIPAYLCYGMKNLTSVSIPNSVTSIGDWAFCGCSGLTSVTIPNSVTSIGSSAFYGCRGLTSVTIPNSVTSIGSYAFYNCSGLTSVVWNAKNCADFAEYYDNYDATYYYGPFCNIASQITSFTFGSEVEHIPAYLCFYMKNLTSVAIPNSVTSIGKDAFEACRGLTSVVWNAKNCADFSRSDYAPFYDIKSQITSFTFGSEVEHIPAYLCFYMKNLTSVTIPNSVTSIGSSAFSGCSGLTSVTIPNSVTSIGVNAFLGCTELRALTLSNSCKTIGSGAFSNCKRLIEINSPAERVPDIEETTFAGVSTTAMVRVPCGSIELYKASNYWNVFSNISGADRFNYSFKSNNETNGTVVIVKEPTCTDWTATIHAYPYQGYEFLGWSDGVQENPRTILVNGDIALTALFSGNNAQIDAVANNDAYGSVCGGGIYPVDETITLTATPNAGYYFVQWSDGNKDNPREVTVNQDSTFTAEFALKQFTISTDAENGTVTGAGTYAYGTKATLTATPNAGYYFVQWSDGNKDNPREVTVNQDSTFTAEFALKQFTVSTDAENGTVTGSGTYADGTKATLTATPNAGYYFVQWSDENKDNPREVTVNQDSTFTAEFALKQFTVSTDAENGTVTGAGTYAYGTKATLTATPNDGYYFVQWSDGNKDNPREVTVNQDSTFTAEFALKQFTVSTDAENGTVTGAGTYAYGTKATLTATPNAGYHFVQWSDGNKDNPREITVTDNAAYTAEFAVCQSVEKLLQITIEKGESYIFAGKTLTAAGTYVDSLHTATGCDSVVTLVLNVHVTPQYTLKVQSENTGKGLVSGGGKYTAGTVIKVMADANEGFEFARWSDNNTENPRWITVTQNQILKAYFDTLCSVEAQVVVGSTVNANAGTVVGTGYFHCGDEVQLQATANTGYAFYRWYNAELGINNTNNPVTLQVPNGTVVTAVFKKSKKTVTTTRSASAMVSVQGRMVYVQNDEPVDVRIYDIIGRTICVANHIVDYMVELKHGAYIVCINDERVKIVIP